VALQTGKGVPFEYSVLQLCREFHCLPEQIKNQPKETMDLILEMMYIENQFQNRKETSNKKKVKF